MMCYILVSTCTKMYLTDVFHRLGVNFIVSYLLMLMINPKKHSPTSEPNKDRNMIR